MRSDPIERIELYLAEHGGIARVRVGRAGTESALTGAVRSGRLTRLRRGWYALPSADPGLCAAVRLGGALTALSVARRHRLWILDDHLLHLAVDLRRSRRRKPAGAGLCVHTAAVPRGDDAACAELPLAVALAQLCVCQPFDSAVAAVDSALNKRLVTHRQLAEQFAEGSARCRRVLAWCDAASQSGTESLVRVRLRRRGIRARPQVRIRGVGRVDLLVGERLVVECDSRRFHDTAGGYAADRARDLELVRLGYTVVRLSYAQVVHGWDEVEPVLLELIRARRHRRPLGRVRA